MPDPTVSKACPACGVRGDANQMGQIYPHNGINGCPYSGTGPVERQGIRPLKFDYGPIITATAAYVDRCQAATVRYELEDPPAAGDFISIRAAHTDEPLGIGKVVVVIEGTLNRVFREVRARSGTRYGHARSSRLKEALNGYYDDAIDYDTEVIGVVYTPHMTGVYRDGTPAVLW